MRINSFNPNMNIGRSTYKESQPAKLYSPQIAPRLSLNEIPSIAFCSIPIQKAVEKLKLPEAFEDFEGELYKIKLIDKATQKKVDAFLGNGKSWLLPEGDIFLVYDKLGEVIGGLSMESAEVINSKTANGKVYAKLHTLDNVARDKFKGVGNTLLQASIEKLMKTEAEGRIATYAWNSEGGRDSFLFYNKNKFSLVSPSLDVGPIVDINESLISAAKVFGLPTDSVWPMIEKIEEFKGKSFSRLSLDEKALSIYETYAHEFKCDMDKLRLDFGENMYLHDNVIKDFWLPQIKDAPVMAQNNRIL